MSPAEPVREADCPSARRAGVQPDAVTFNLALKACEAPATSKLAPGLLRSAFELLRCMARQGVRPDVRTYTTLLSLCAQAGDAQAALAVHAVPSLATAISDIKPMLETQKKKIGFSLSGPSSISMLSAI